MARPLRIAVPGGWYHVSTRGIERRRIFLENRERRHFLELLARWVQRFGLRLHAYVLMDNHYHLLVETPEANLARAMQWLGLSYATWFNRRHGRVGPLFQGRYHAVLVEADGAAWEVSRYLHLNPVRIAELGLGKWGQRQAALGAGGPADTKLVGERLGRLRRYRWSSYRKYVGWARVPRWLTTAVLLEQTGPGSLAQRQQAYRRAVEGMIIDGVMKEPWAAVVGQTLLGGTEFVERMRRLAWGNRREQPSLKALEQPVAWSRIVRALERLKGERWEAFWDRRGDWGRDVALYLGRWHGRLSLGELAKLAGGLDYGSVQMAVKRLEQRLPTDRPLRRVLEQLERELQNVGC